MPTRPGAYEYFHTDQDGTPARWQTCRIQYTVNPGPGTAQTKADVITRTKKAVDQIGRAAGIEFEYTGRTRNTPHGRTNWWTEPNMGGSDLVIAYSSSKRMPRLHGTIGLGGPIIVDTTNGPAITKAGITIPVRYRPQSKHPDTSVLLHQLGHALGLGHPENPEQVMSAGGTAVRPQRLQKGDIAGLNALKPASCPG